MKKPPEQGGFFIARSKPVLSGNRPRQQEMKMENRQTIGANVIYVDERGNPHNALVTHWHSQDCCNLLFISSDEMRCDNFGRQIERRSSCVHQKVMPAHGNYFSWPDER
jgi:hypothetical protein